VWEFFIVGHRVVSEENTGSSCFLEQRYEVGLRGHKDTNGKFRLKRYLMLFRKNTGSSYLLAEIRGRPRNPPEEVFLEPGVVLEVLGDLTDETLEGKLRRGGKKASLNRRKVSLEAGSTSSLTGKKSLLGQAISRTRRWKGSFEEAGRKSH
jgi:hypothetical protein